MSATTVRRTITRRTVATTPAPPAVNLPTWANRPHPAVAAQRTPAQPSKPVQQGVQAPVSAGWVAPVPSMQQAPSRPMQAPSRPMQAPQTLPPMRGSYTLPANFLAALLGAAGILLFILGVIVGAAARSGQPVDATGASVGQGVSAAVQHSVPAPSQTGGSQGGAQQNSSACPQGWVQAGTNGTMCFPVIHITPSK